MPQGKVIAVTPSSAGGVEFRSFSSTETFNYSSSTTGHKPGVRKVYIGVCRDENILKCKRKNVTSVVWFVDEERRFSVGDYVTFDIDEGNTKAISTAQNVEKAKIGGVPLPGGIFSKVALLASLLLHRSLLHGLLPGFFFIVAVWRCSSVFHRVVIYWLYFRFSGWQRFIEGS